MKKAKAYRTFSEVKCDPSAKAAVYAIVDLGPVSTDDGEMRKVRLDRGHTDVANPGTELAVAVGKAIPAKGQTQSAAYASDQPTVWWWNDCFWLKARDAEGMEYYHSKAFILHKVKLTNPDVLTKMDLDMNVHDVDRDR